MPSMVLKRSALVSRLCNGVTWTTFQMLSWSISKWKDENIQDVVTVTTVVVTNLKQAGSHIWIMQWTVQELNGTTVFCELQPISPARASHRQQVHHSIHDSAQLKKLQDWVLACLRYLPLVKHCKVFLGMRNFMRDVTTDGASQTGHDNNPQELFQCLKESGLTQNCHKMWMQLQRQQFFAFSIILPVK